MQKIKLTAVSYINTIPFVEAIRNTDILQKNITLWIDYPAKCATYLESEKVDGGLVPVGALAELPSTYQIITNFCIGANGKVATVAVLGQKERNKIKIIYLDYQSRTSVKLLQILAIRYWQQKFVYRPYTDGLEENLKDDEAVLLIGDKVFKYEHLFMHKIDLAEEWKKWTKLPFVFAVWVGNKKTLPLENELNKSFYKYQKDISGLYTDDLKIEKKVFLDYLKNKIDFILDEDKQKAIRLFLQITKEEKNKLL